MATPTAPAQTVKFKTITLPEYSTDTSKTLCKVVQVKVRLTEGTDCNIALRGENGPLLWDQNFPSLEVKGSKIEKRSFEFSVAPQLNSVTLKCVLEGPKGICWQNGDNTVVDLSGKHVVKVKMNNVSFQGM